MRRIVTVFLAVIACHSAFPVRYTILNVGNVPQALVKSPNKIPRDSNHGQPKLYHYTVSTSASTLIIFNIHTLILYLSSVLYYCITSCWLYCQHQAKKNNFYLREIKGNANHIQLISAVFISCHTIWLYMIVCTVVPRSFADWIHICRLSMIADFTLFQISSLWSVYHHITLHYISSLTCPV